MSQIESRPTANPAVRSLQSTNSGKRLGTARPSTSICICYLRTITTTASADSKRYERIHSCFRSKEITRFSYSPSLLGAGTYCLPPPQYPCASRLTQNCAPQIWSCRSPGQVTRSLRWHLRRQFDKVALPNSLIRPTPATGPDPFLLHHGERVK